MENKPYLSFNVLRRKDGENLRPKKTAEKFKMSASTLRNYEAKGLIPPAERSPNGYRKYTLQHELYLACIQAMAPAFGMEVTTVVLHSLLRSEWDKALWIVREKEVILYEEKKKVEQLKKELEEYFNTGQGFSNEKRFSIHEVSSQTGVQKTAIRYWEKDGFFTAERNPENDYRLYNETDLVKIKFIQVLQNCVYSEDTVALKQSIKMLDQYNVEEISKLADQVITYLNKTIRSQMQAMAPLCELVDFITS